MLKQCMGCHPPISQKENNTERGYIALTNTDSKWQDHWMVLNSPGFPPITAAPATSPFPSLPRHVFTSSTYQAHGYLCCTKHRTGVPAGGIPMPSVTAVPQEPCSKPAVTGSITPLKTPCEPETSGVERFINLSMKMNANATYVPR